MSDFTAYDPATGEVLFSGTADDLPSLARPDRAILAEIAPPGTYRSGSAWVAIPARPSPEHVWDWASHAWVAPG